MEFDLVQEFPVGLDRLWCALGRAEYVEGKYRSLGSTSLRILRLDADATSIEVELEREAPVAVVELPVWARAFAPARQRMRHRTRWRRAGPHRIDAELDIRAVGEHVAATGRGSVIELSPTRSRMSLRFDVTCTSRAFKSRVETVFARQVQHALRVDHAYTLDHLRAGSRRR
jgi:hypothetical protein